MGNTGSGLPYENRPDSEASDIRGTHWSLRRGNKIQADERGDRPEVSIFRFDKAAADAVPVAQRNWQKLRTMRHPYIVSVLDGIDMEKELIVVTEPVTPLEDWLSDCSTAEEVVWGFKCILEALSFVHVNCHTLHGYIGPHAVYVAKNGDWKLGAMDLACVLADDEDLFRGNEHRLDTRYRAPERRDGSWGGVFGRAADKPSSAFGAMDVFGLGVVFREVCDRLSSSGGAALPAGLDRIIQKMTSPEFKKRPVCAQILRQGVFVSGAVVLMATLNELALKQPQECSQTLQELRESVAAITVPVCSFKVLPVVARMLNSCVGDFQNRDARENCRQMIQTCTGLLADLIAAKKVEQASFTAVCLEGYLPLWGMSDRIVRTELLKTLKPLSEVLSEDSINKKIFDNMLTGFSDSNAKMREDTLKNLVCVVSKLEERNLQEKLVRCMVNLQGDAEPSIRTNATIFLGRIAPDLKEAIRCRVLPGAFVKAMKDGFVHCRVAGVRAAAACVQLIDTPQLCGKVMPQVCILLLDPSQDVRELAIDMMKTSMGPVNSNHQRLCREYADAVKERDLKRGSVNTPTARRPELGVDSPGAMVTPVTSGPAGGDNGQRGWTSWAVDGLSKTIEKAVLVDQAAQEPGTGLQAVESPPAYPKAMKLATSSSRVVPSSPADPRTETRSISAFNPDDEDNGANAGGWGDSFEVDIDDPDTQSSKVVVPDVAEANGWDDGDDWMQDLNETNPKPNPVSASRSNNSLSSTTCSGRARSGNEKTSKVAKPVKKIGATKLKVDKTSENWDDF